MLNLWRSYNRKGYTSLIIINAEYKQSLDTNKEYSFNQYSVGVGLRGKALYYPIVGVFLFLYSLVEVEY